MPFAMRVIHDLLRHFVFSHVQSKTISRKDARIANKTLASAVRPRPNSGGLDKPHEGR